MCCRCRCRCCCRRALCSLGRPTKCVCERELCARVVRAKAVAAAVVDCVRVLCFCGSARANYSASKRRTKESARRIWRTRAAAFARCTARGPWRRRGRRSRREASQPLGQRTHTRTHNRSQRGSKIGENDFARAFSALHTRKADRDAIAFQRDAHALTLVGAAQAVARCPPSAPPKPKLELELKQPKRGPACCCWWWPRERSRTLPHLISSEPGLLSSDDDDDYAGDDGKGNASPEPRHRRQQH